MTTQDIREILETASMTGADSIKKAYYRLCLKFHPDRKGGDLEIMKLVNTIYDSILESMTGKSYSYKDRNDNDQSYTYRYDQTKEDTIKQQIFETLSRFESDCVDACTVLLVGSWLWIAGDTRPHRATFKALKYRWHSKRSMWYWCIPTKGRRRYSKNMTFDKICDKYGCEQVGSRSSGAVPA